MALKGQAELIKRTKPRRNADAKQSKAGQAHDQEAGEARKDKADKQREPEAEPFSLTAAVAAQMQAARDALALPNATAAVHEARIALKRLRMLARIADHVTPQGGAALEWGAQALMKQLAHARDLAAMEHTAERVADLAKGDARAYLARVAGAFARQRRLAEISALSEAATGLLRLQPIADAIPEAPPQQARRAARAFARRAQGASAAARGRRKLLARHTWRKREKDRRNAALVFGRNWPGPIRAATARRLTEALGRERDALLLHDWLAPLPRTPKSVLRLIERYRRQRARRADKLGKRLHRR